MTDYLIDLASYQEGIDLAKVRAAGFTRVNIKLSQGNWYQWANASTYIQRARDLGLGICTFHWLDNSSSGAEQARIVLGLMRRYSILEGTAHQCDCEDSAKPASYTTWRDYMNAMQDALQRHVVNYTGDWWWPQHMGNRGAEVTPYLWAAPNAGYLGSYAGDTSGHWHAGYGGWGDYSMLQYAVQPIAGAGGGNLSKTAIRDPAVWAALTGGKQMAFLDDPDAAIAAWRLDALAYGSEVIRGGPAKGQPMEVVRTINNLAGDVLALKAAIAQVLAKPAVTLDADQVTQLGADLAAVLVAHPDTPLGEADIPAMTAALDRYFRTHFGQPE